jgi:SAM-dependent methyltransferase
MEILDHYILTRPSAQNALDIFQGEWSSKLPDEFGLVTKPGTAALFEDARIEWAEQHLGGFAGRSVLELGPLEGGHSYMLQKRGAARVVAIEANTRCYLKCLCVKEVLGLDKVDFLLGDFIAFMEESTARFDVLVASGVLYHMTDPIALLRLIGKSSDRVMLWTHFYDEAIIRASSVLSPRFGTLRSFTQDGHTYQCATQSYQVERTKAAFCGGAAPVSNWLTKDSLVQALRNLGYTGIEVGFEAPHHPNGPSLALCATR